MHGILEVMGVALTALLAENFVLVSCMGIGSRTKALAEPKDALGTGFCLTLVMVMSSVLAWVIDVAVLTRFGLLYYRTFIFALLVPSVVWLVSKFFKYFIPELYRRHREHLGAVTTNGAALGCVLLVALRSYGLAESIIYALCGGVGTTVVLANFAHLQSEADLEQCPKCFRGIPIQMVTMGLMAMGLVGFYGLHIHWHG